uniref:Uncharacterized protein n=1 Tax=Plectus sambesii TaxID=2011161 RepID=A0A914UZ78_9BILA
MRDSRPRLRGHSMSPLHAARHSYFCVNEAPPIASCNDAVSYEVTSISDRRPSSPPDRSTRTKIGRSFNVDMMMCVLSTLISTLGVVAGVQQQQSASGFTLPPIGVQLPAAMQVAPEATNQLQPEGHDCRAAVICNQGAWADFGLALAGLMPKQDICYKYQPSSSCASIALTRCRGKMDEAAEQLLVAFAHIVVSWCYDDGQTLEALNQYSPCYSMAALDSLITHSCLSKVAAPHSMHSISSAVGNRSPEERAAFAKIIGTFLGGYQSGAIVCLHKAVKDTCGLDAANLVLGPALEQLKPSALLPTNSTTEPTTSSSTVAPDRMGDRSFCGAAIGSKRSCNLLVVTRSDQLWTSAVDCLFSEAVRMGRMGGHVLWFRSEPIDVLPREFAHDARRALSALRQITFRYFGPRLAEELSAFCSEMHLRKCPDLLVVELAESDVAADSVRAALIAMLADAANWIAQRRTTPSTVFPLIVALNEADHKHFDDLFTDCSCSLSLSDECLSIISHSTTNTFRLNNNVYTKEAPLL